METKDWLLLLSTALSPVIAVCVTLWWQQRKERRDAKFRLFATLMAYRKAYPISYEWASSLNQIVVLFSDSPTVVDHWNRYYDLLNLPVGQRNVPDQNHKYLELMRKMAEELGLGSLQQTDIDRYYVPQVHGDQADTQYKVQQELLRVLQNTASIAVELNSKNPDAG